MPTDNKELRLSAPAQVGGIRFGVNVAWRTVIEAAQRHYKYMMEPEREEARIKVAGEFVKRLRESATAYAPPITPQESDARELQAARDMLESARQELREIRAALGVSYEPHQNLHERTLDAARRGAPDGDIVDSQERILDAAKHWAEQRDIGPAHAKAAWADFQLRVQAELNYTHAIASDPQEEVGEERRDEHPDDVAVQAFAQAMKSKLAKKRADGRGGWQQCDANTLSSMLSDHVAKGDPVDVANLAMMLHQNGQSICRTSDFSEGVNIERLRRAMAAQGIAAPESLEELAATLARHVNALTLAIAEKKHKCDGNHGGPRCADPECWNDSPADPMFWYRPRSDGGYEGPLHNSSIEEVRKRSGAWVPLFAGRAPGTAPDSGTDSLKSALRPFSEEFKQWDGVGCWDSMTLDEMFSHAPGETAGITFADLRRANELLEKS
ncbi:hypothetical protein [Pusillimonas noertemannii]|uniref:Uncharacterized protein n=1 Tax=Pusillimonas noertemannii TaxID=305977 RepID=A0A2U1CMJ1_9BURK|nr:hypothetical protein [Pusillimonas noertemannii]NYT68749.1 hypothetical protein [Pusillimonas noertemannii]PVY62230.1 hypothetical protein C7440_1723 [Pusillimonas noertemannii]TFL10790.1 hypothetical protein CSC72_09750 [Pusillimonas noertemannii]